MTAADAPDPELHGFAGYAWLFDMAAALTPAPAPDKSEAEGDGGAEPRAA